MTKKKITFLSILSFILTIILVITGFNFIDFNDPDEWPVEQKNLGYYADSWHELQGRFIAQAKRIRGQNSQARFDSFAMPDSKGPSSVDSLYLPAHQKKSNLIIIISGTHGLEGFVGSAIQNMFMQEFLDRSNLQKYPDTGYFLIHSLNPWGMQHFRRVTQNNVDLNRNSTQNDALYKTQNKGYSALYDFLNPQKKLDMGSLENLFFRVRALMQIAQSSIAVLRQAILQGQYAYPEGIYFGGQRTEPQIVYLAKLARRVMAEYQTIVIIDLHTGYGQRGRLHLFPNPPENDVIKQNIQKLYAGYQIDWGNDKDFYTVTGDLIGMLSRIYPQKNNIPMAFEFGTRNSQTTTGSIDSLHTMIMENQGHYHGYKDPGTHNAIQKQAIEMYFPSSQSWRSHTMELSRKLFLDVLKNLAAMDQP